MWLLLKALPSCSHDTFCIIMTTDFDVLCVNVMLSNSTVLATTECSHVDAVLVDSYIALVVCLVDDFLLLFLSC